MSGVAGAVPGVSSLRTLREVAFVLFWLGALKLSRAVHWQQDVPTLALGPAVPQLCPPAPACSFVSWLFPSCFSAHSADGAAAHRTFIIRGSSAERPALPTAGAVELAFPHVAMAALRAGGASFV